jgi:hypothetical protein
VRFFFLRKRGAGVGEEDLSEVELGISVFGGEGVLGKRSVFGEGVFGGEGASLERGYWGHVRHVAASGE